jgi:hypothetical protein
MKRKNRFLIGLISAAITFSSLLIILGPKHIERHACHHSCNHQAVEQSNNQETHH